MNMAAKEPKHIDITHRPELLQLVEQMRKSNEPLLLQEGSRNVAIVRPLYRPTKPRGSQLKPFTKDDPIWNLLGIGRSGLTDVSENTDKYLAEAYLDTHDQEQ